MQGKLTPQEITVEVGKKKRNLRQGVKARVFRWLGV
jgi:hypothetical protein